MLKLGHTSIPEHVDRVIKTSRGKQALRRAIGGKQAKTVISGELTERTDGQSNKCVLVASSLNSVQS